MAMAHCVESFPDVGGPPPVEEVGSAVAMPPTPITGLGCVGVRSVWAGVWVNDNVRRFRSRLQKVHPPDDALNTPAGKRHHSVEPRGGDRRETPRAVVSGMERHLGSVGKFPRAGRDVFSRKRTGPALLRAAQQLQDIAELLLGKGAAGVVGMQKVPDTQKDDIRAARALFELSDPTYARMPPPVAAVQMAYNYRADGGCVRMRR